MTPTGELTVTAPATPTTPVASGLPTVTASVATTANLRAGPGTTFDLLGQAAPGSSLAIVGISEDGQWYLLDGGAWIAVFLVAEQPANVPVATQELIDQAAGRVPVPAATAALPSVNHLNVLLNDADPDGAVSDLTVATQDPGASVAGGKVIWFELRRPPG